MAERGQRVDSTGRRSRLPGAARRPGCGELASCSLSSGTRCHRDRCQASGAARTSRTALVRVGQAVAPDRDRSTGKSRPVSGRTSVGEPAMPRSSGRRDRFGALTSCSAVSPQGRLVADEPEVAERIEEAALAVCPPRRLVVPHGIAAAVRAGRHGPPDEGVGVVDEDLDPHGRRADRGGAVPPVVRRLGQEEGRPADLQTDDRRRGSTAPWRRGRACTSRWPPARPGPPPSARSPGRGILLSRSRLLD